MQIRFNELMSSHTTFRIGGPADMWVEVRDIEELNNILYRAKNENKRVFFIGNGSNILVRDKGFRGIVVCLNSGYFKKLSAENIYIDAGAGVRMKRLLGFAKMNGLAGVEFMAGIPATVGAAVKLNAGGIGRFVENKTTMEFKGEELILKVRFRLEKEEPYRIGLKINEFFLKKREIQELTLPSAGCIFRNVKGFPRSGILIEQSGFKGYRAGGAVVSEKHANFILNTNGATADDVLRIIDAIRKKVKIDHRVLLDLELEIV